MVGVNPDYYSLHNTFLSNQQKQEVEMWFQLPGYVMSYVFCLTAMLQSYYDFHWLYIIIISVVVNLIIGFLNWYLYSYTLTNLLYVSFFRTIPLLIVGILTAILLIIKSSYALAILSLLSPFNPFPPHIIEYAILSRKYKMHPKYAFFKKFHNFHFIFEDLKQ